MQLLSGQGQQLHQKDDAILIQANPVQNTWYNVLPTKPNARIYLASLVVGTANESLDMRILVDGIVVSGSISATFGTVYRAIFNYGIASNSLALVTVDQNCTYILEGSNVSVDVRKTSATGAGTLSAKVVYAVRDGAISI